jgi:predicted MPP superfamily phosphohydrolase
VQALCGLLLLLTACSSGKQASPAPLAPTDQKLDATDSNTQVEALVSHILGSAGQAGLGLLPAPQRWRIAFASDLNERYGNTCYEAHTFDAMDAIRRGEPALVVFAGDMIAGQKRDLDYRAMWDAFISDILGFFQGLHVAQCAGNHDASGYPRYEQERAIYLDVWSHLPRPSQTLFDSLAPTASRYREDLALLDEEHYPLRYTMRVGPAMLIFLDATHRDALDTAQLDWLEAQLTTPIASELGYIIVVGHLPLYPLTQGRERDYLLGQDSTRERVERLFFEHDVDLYVSGHHHGYYDAYSPRMPTRLIGLGCLGGGPRALLESERLEDPGSARHRMVLWVELEASCRLGAGPVPPTSCGVRASFQALAGPSFEQADRIAPDTLPLFIGEPPLLLLRADLFADG